MITLVDAALEQYAVDHSSQVPELMNSLRDYTLKHTDLPQMQVGPLEGNFLKVLARLVRAERIVEVGTFTGYSTLMMASALPEKGELITCELDPDNAKIARSFFDKSPHGAKIRLELGRAEETLQKVDGPFDMAFIDADKEGYIRYFDLIYPKMRSGGLIVADNVLWSGRVLEPLEKQAESTRAITAFNTYLRDKVTSDKIMLTVRDGMTMVVV